MELNPIFRSVVSAMQSYAPLSLADTAWDNVGSLVEAPFIKDSPQHQKLKNVMLCIDLTPAVLDEAIGKDCAAIVAYHPLIFSGIKKLAFSNPKSNHTTITAIRCVSHGISVYSPHTSLDAVKGGINDWLCDVVAATDLEQESVKPITRIESCSESKQGQEGYGRVASLSGQGQPLSVILDRLKAGLGLPTLRVAVPPSVNDHSEYSVKHFAVCAGSGGSVFRDVPKAFKKNNGKVDLMLTGEMSHHEVLALVQQGTVVVLTEHTNTERGFLMARLQPYLETAIQAGGKKSAAIDFGGVYCSELDKDPLVVV